MRTAVALLIALTAYGAPHDHDYRVPHGAGYGTGIVDRTLGDLRRASWNGRLDGHERGHFNGAAKELEKFQDKWREGRFETKHLDKAIEHLRHLVDADRLHPRDRGILAHDLDDLRSFRHGPGYRMPERRPGYGWPR